MGKGKSKPSKKPRKPVRKKRQLPEGLRRWNQVRSYLSKENKKSGKKYNGVELNALSKAFLLEYFDTDFTQRDIETYVSTEVPEFYSNALDVPAHKLGPFKYFQMDGAIRDLPTGLLVIVDANGFGKINISTSNYDYHSSGMRDIVELIRLEAQESYEGYEFRGFVIKNERPQRKKKQEPESLVLFILYVDGVAVGDTEGLAPLPPAEDYDRGDDEVPEIEKQKQRVAEKEKKNEEQRKKKKATDQKPVEKSEKERMLELQNENLRLQNEKAKNVLALIKAGYTKAEIKKMGL